MAVRLDRQSPLTAAKISSPTAPKIADECTSAAPASVSDDFDTLPAPRAEAPVSAGLKEAVAGDVARLAIEIERSPEGAAAWLADRLSECEGSPYATALLAESHPHLEKLCAELVTGAEPKNTVSLKALTALCQAAESSGHEGARIIARALALAVPDASLHFRRDGSFGWTLREAVQQGAGMLLGAELGHALEDLGKTQASSQVARALVDGLEQLRDDFEDETQRIATLDTTLASFGAGFGPFMEKENLKAAIQTFKSRHAEEYAQWEAAGSRYTSVLEGASAALSRPPITTDPRLGLGFEVNHDDQRLREESLKAMHLLPALGETAQGMKALGQALKAQGQGKETFLDALPEAVRTSKYSEAYQRNMQALLARAAAVALLHQNIIGQNEDIPAILEGLERSAKAVGIKDKEVGNFLHGMKSMAGDMPDKQLRDLLENLNRQLIKLIPALELGDSVAADGRAVGAFKGLSIAIGVIAAIKDLRKWDQATDGERLKMVGDTLDTGLAGGAFALDSIERVGVLLGGSVHAASTVLLALGPVAGLLSSIGDGVEAFQAFDRDDIPDGIAHSAVAVGGTLIAVPVLPAQVVGGALLAGGAATHFVKNKVDEVHSEKDLRAFLTTGGFSDGMIARVDNLTRQRVSVGPLLLAVAANLKTTPPKLLKAMETWPEEELNSFFRLVSFPGARELPGLKKKTKPLGEKGVDIIADHVRKHGLPVG